MAMEQRMSGWRLRCNKCGGVIRSEITLITRAATQRLSNKFTACPKCLVARLTRDSKSKRRKNL